MNSKSTGKFAHNAHSIGMSEYHLQWITKYRYETLLKEQHYKDCKNAIRSAAKRHGIELLELGVTLDHVHVVVLLLQHMSPGKAVTITATALDGAPPYTYQWASESSTGTFLEVISGATLNTHTVTIPSSGKTGYFIGTKDSAGTAVASAVVVLSASTC